MSTIITNLRGTRVTPIHRGSVLLSKQEDLCSTSYYSPLGIPLLYESLLSIGNTPALRGITLREGRILPLYESLLFEKEKYFHSTGLTRRVGVLTRRAEIFLLGE